MTSRFVQGELVLIQTTHGATLHPQPSRNLMSGFTYKRSLCPRVKRLSSCSWRPLSLSLSRCTHDVHKIISMAQLHADHKLHDLVYHVFMHHLPNAGIVNTCHLTTWTFRDTQRRMQWRINSSCVSVWKGTDAADISIGEGVRHHNAKYYPVLICSFVKIVAEHGDNLAAAR